MCLRGLARLKPEDRPFVALFLNIEIELVASELHCGDLEAAIKRVEDLLAYHQNSDNPLTRGRLHEIAARVSAAAQDWPSYRHHLEETRTWYRSTSTAALVARLAALEALDPSRASEAATKARAPSANETAQLQPVRAPFPK